MLNISESYTIGFDLGEGDKAILTVVKYENGKMLWVNGLIGDDAISTYEKLTNISLERGATHE